VDVDAQHRTLVAQALFASTRLACRSRNFALPHALPIHRGIKEAMMGRGILLWLLGVPIPVIILLWLFFGH
jgi:hypothetical protein